MLEKYLRQSYQRIFILPLIKLCAKQSWVTPNRVSILAAIMGIFAGLAIFIAPALAIFLLLLSGYLDTLDGSLARHKQLSSAVGTVLDIFGDRVVEISVIFGLCLLDPNHRLWLGLFMLSAILLCITSFLVVGIFIEHNKQQHKKSFHYSPGLVERPEAFVFFIVMILLPDYFSYLASIFSLLVLYTAFRRIVEFYRFN